MICKIRNFNIWNLLSILLFLFILGCYLIYATPSIDAATKQEPVCVLLNNLDYTIKMATEYYLNGDKLMTKKTTLQAAHLMDAIRKSPELPKAACWDHYIKTHGDFIKLMKLCYPHLTFPPIITR